MYKKAGTRWFLPLLLLLWSAPRAHAVYSYAGVTATLQELASRPQVPGAPRLQVVSIGSTVKGRDILMAVLSAPADEGEDVPPPGEPFIPMPDLLAPESPAAPAVQPPLAPASPEAAPAAPDSEDGTLVLSLEPVNGPLVVPTAQAPAPAAAVDALLEGAGSKKVLLLCRQHGNEPAPTEAAMQFLKEYATTEDPAKIDLLRRVTILVVPMLNSDGAEKYERRNANNVDLNRDWLHQSQPETRVITRMVQEWKPDLVVDAHELATSDWTASFVEAMEPEAGAAARIGEACNTATAAVVGPLRADSMRIYARPVFNYREPRLAHRYFAIKQGVPTILVETRRAGSVPLEDRTRVHFAAFTAVTRYMAGEPLETPSRVVEAWLEPGSVKEFRTVQARKSGTATASAQAKRPTQLASRGGSAQSTAAKREAARKKLALQKKKRR